ncbi:Putative LRR receptor-like serine/threonine-protein kinase, partial [Glycine soja]
VYNCVLNIQFSSSLINSNCELYHWGGFTNGCCGPYFDGYLYDLGPKANQTGKIFLNSSEQKNCIASMEAFNKKFTCYGIEKITSGVGGCSDYTITDVISKIGDNFRRLNEDCMPLSRNGRPNETCTKCLKTWEDIIAKSDSTRESESANASDYLCRFAVLVSLTSTRIYDRESIQEVYKCLGEYSHSSVNQEVKVKASANANINSRKVYKGVLSNNQSVAVKHVTNEVYDLCHNGNLSEWLFGNGKVLSWIQRLEIAIDSARGLEFLHTYPNGCIVHRDIKNVVRGGDISEFADPKLKGEYSVETFDIVLKLALSCIGLKRQRPSIEQVLYSLEKALDISL